MISLHNFPGARPFLVRDGFIVASGSIEAMEAAKRLLEGDSLESEDFQKMVTRTLEEGRKAVERSLPQGMPRYVPPARPRNTPPWHTATVMIYGAPPEPTFVRTAQGQLQVDLDNGSEITKYQLTLDEVSEELSLKIKAIEIVRHITGLGLHEAKTFVETVPRTVTSGMSRPQALAIKLRFEAVGAKATIS